MFCDECKAKPAAVHVTKVVNNTVMEMHLCPECANRKFGGPEGFLQPPFYMPDMVANLVPAFAEAQAGVQHTREKCPVCGYGFADFLNTGLLGCSNCYNVFSNELGDIIRKIHGSTRHTGKILKRSAGEIKTRRSISDLHKLLEQLVKEEKYEEAAKMRDRIKGLEKKRKGD